MSFRLLPALIAVLLAPGCVMVQIGVTNPIPGLTTVAIVPFLNLSPERAVDGRRFALTYASELQKIPGFEVIPVGVCETAMIDAKIDLNDVDEVLKLAKILRVDAIVVGAVTEYSPYYPPRIGMQINWYSPKAWQFYPGIQVEPAQRCQLKDWDRQRRQEWRDYQQRMDDATAPETPAWERMYRRFKRWPVIRTVYGEPTLCRIEDHSPLLWRAQSPAVIEDSQPRSLGVQPSSQPAAAEPNAVVQANQTETAGIAPPAAASGEPSTVLVKIPHYQESQGPSSTVRVALSHDDSNARFGARGAQPSIPLPDASEAPPGGPPPMGNPPSAPGSSRGPGSAGEPAPLPKDVRAPPAPRPDDGPTTPPTILPETPFDRLPFGPETPGMLPVPSKPGGPLPMLEEPLEKEPPRMQPVRDPHLAPPTPQPNPYNVPQPIQPWQADPRLPLMSYTRLFDGADADLVAALRDYVELNGDLRSGGWEAYLHRSDDFIRFSSFRMILEMLSLHGGEGKHRMVFKFRKYK